MPLGSRTLALALVCSGCGARSGLADGIIDTADGGALDAAVDSAVGLDASIEPLACDGRPLARPGAVTEVAIPPRMHGLGALIPDPLGLLLVGGDTAFGERASEMVFLDLGAGVSQDLPVDGDPVVLPTSEAAAVYVPDFVRVVVIGGTDAGGAPTDQVFWVLGQGDPSGIRSVWAQLLSPYPGGPVREPGAIWDPVGHRVVVHGGVGPDGATAGTRATLSLRLDDAGQTNWDEILAGDQSPPAGVRAMGYDPVRNRAIEVTDDEDGTGLAVYALSLEVGRESWSRLGEIDFAPSTRGELLWDAASCGFHLLTARRTRCVLEHWILVVGDETAETVYRGELDLQPSHFIAASTFVAARDRLVVYGSEDCEAPLTPNLVAHEIALVR